MQMPHDLKLPTRFDPKVKPRIKREWFALADGWRCHSWWWHVAYIIRSKRVRHKDAEKIERIMRLVDEKLPHLREDYTRGASNASYHLPSYERLLRGEIRGHIGTTRNS